MRSVLAQLEGRKADEMKLKRDVDRACRILERLEQRLEQLKAAEKDLDRRKKRALAKYESFENAVIAALQSRSLERVDGIERVLRLQAAPPSIEVFDPSRIPAAYMRQPKPQPAQPDKVLIKKILERANADDASEADIATAPDPQCRGHARKASGWEALRCWAMISIHKVDVWWPTRQKPNAYERSSPSVPDVRV